MSAERTFEWDYAEDVTPNDSNDLATPWAVGLHVKTGGTGGDITFHNYDGTSSTISLAAGEYKMVPVRRVLSTGTTASGIVALKRSK